MWIQTDKGKYRSSDDRFTLTKIDSINWELFDVQTKDTYSAKNTYCKQHAEGVLRREAPKTTNTACYPQRSPYKPRSKSTSHSKRTIHTAKRLWSVLTSDMNHCMFTGSADIERHHVFGGISSVKANSEKYGSERDEKGKFQPGNKAATQRGPNKVSAKVRESIVNFLENNVDAIQESFDELKPKEKLNKLWQQLKRKQQPVNLMQLL